MGGIANAVWGRPRATRDVDFKILLGERTTADLVALIASHFRLRVSNPATFARQTHVVPIYAGNGVPIDLAIGLLPYEEQAIERAIDVEFGDIQFPVCTAEDLIIHKAISEREKDWADIEGVLVRQGNRLNQEYVESWLTQFAEALERPQLLQRYEQLRQKTESAGQ
ncbi:MAG: nucleotidyltransferase [Anaerolineae bacterium]